VLENVSSAEKPDRRRQGSRSQDAPTDGRPRPAGCTSAAATPSWVRDRVSGLVRCRAALSAHASPHHRHRPLWPRTPLTLGAGDNDTRTVSRTTTTVRTIGPVRPRKVAP
jgi:hypothetical protein